jgi:predicted CoA-binding protein
MKKTLILGASTNPNRYSNLAANRLVNYGHPIINVGQKTGEVANHPIEKAQHIHQDIHTITMYIGPAGQKDLHNYILDTNPKRIIFNPGSENPELVKLANDKGIETLEACTLVMLSTNQY